MTDVPNYRSHTRNDLDTAVPLSFCRLWRKNTRHPLCGWSLTQLEVM